MDSSTRSTLKNSNKSTMFQSFKQVIWGVEHGSIIETKHRRCTKYHDPDQHLITYVSVGEEEGLVFPAVSLLSSEKKTGDAGEDGELAGEDSYEINEEKNVAGRKKHLLRRACREVFLRVSCQKNMMESKSKFITKHSNPSEEDPQKLKKPLKGDPTRQPDYNVSSSSWSSWSGFSSSTSSSRTQGSLSSSQRSRPSFQSCNENSNKDQGQEHRCRGFTFGFCTVLVTLVVLILWGKACSVLCTSMWFFLVTRRNIKGNVSEDKRLELSEEVLSSEAYKKRIVMEGLLRRERCLYTSSMVAASV